MNDPFDLLRDQLVRVATPRRRRRHTGFAFLAATLVLSGTAATAAVTLTKSDEPSAPLSGTFDPPEATRRAATPGATPAATATPRAGATPPAAIADPRRGCSGAGRRHRDVRRVHPARPGGHAGAPRRAAPSAAPPPRRPRTTRSRSCPT